MGIYLKPPTMTTRSGKHHSPAKKTSSTKKCSFGKRRTYHGVKQSKRCPENPATRRKRLTYKRAASAQRRILL